MAKHSSDAVPPRTAPLDDPADAVETVRSEERLLVGRERVPVRIARLQKVVVTEQRTITVEVRHEEARLVYEDLPAGGLPEERSARLADALPELVLSEEQIRVTTVTVPVERVRAVIETVAGEQVVTGEVRVERVELERSAPGSDGR